MGLGSILVGIAAAIVVAAYVALPFRRTGGAPDRVIETWVAQVRAGSRQVRRAASAPEPAQGSEPMNYCPQCGRRVGPDDLFCARCGARLRDGTE
jgi:hypothetical protein